MTNVIATICARGGSKGVPGKNLRKIGGKSLVERAVMQALRLPMVNAGVFVSTDDEQIADAARSAGAVVPYLRPAELATDAAGKIPVLIHLRDFLVEQGHEFDVIVDLDPTCPLRHDADILETYEKLCRGTDVVFSCCEARKNPYFNMVEANREGFYTLSKSIDDGPVRRQDAPRVYEINGAVYAWYRDTLDKGLWDGNADIHVMPAERSVDIDSALDLAFVEWLMDRELDRS